MKKINFPVLAAMPNVTTTVIISTTQKMEKIIQSILPKFTKFLSPVSNTVIKILMNIRASPMQRKIIPFFFKERFLLRITPLLTVSTYSPSRALLLRKSRKPMWRNHLRTLSQEPRTLLVWII